MLFFWTLVPTSRVVNADAKRIGARKKENETRCLVGPRELEWICDRTVQAFGQIEDVHTGLIALSDKAT